MATRYIDNSTIKRLFADSKGICAKCDTDLFPNGDLVGEICHIEAYSPGGNQYNKLLKKEKKENHYDNLIVLCSNCHKTIDLKKNEDLYGTDFLLSLKINHQQKSITKQTPELNENKTEIISNIFSISIEKEIVEIKSLLNTLIGNHCFGILQAKFNRKSVFSPSTDNINTFFFSQADLAIVETIRKGSDLDQPQSYILVGPPSSGKTTLMLKIANELPQIFTHFYLSLNEEHSLDSIRRDLKYIKSFQSIVYIDDCHLNNDLACEIYYECSTYSNITLIFLYREINELSRVSQIGYNLFDDLVSEVFIIDPFTNQNEKINALIENRQKIIFREKGIDAKIGNSEVIYDFIDKNLLKLSLLLDEWEKQPTEILDQITDDKLNRLLHKRGSSQ